MNLGVELTSDPGCPPRGGVWGSVQLGHLLLAIRSVGACSHQPPGQPVGKQLWSWRMKLHDIIPAPNCPKVKQRHAVANVKRGKKKPCYRKELKTSRQAYRRSPSTAYPCSALVLSAPCWFPSFHSRDPWKPGGRLGCRGSWIGADGWRRA